MSAFSEKLSSLMKEKGLNQKELAAKAKVTESAMSYYVKGTRTPRSDVLTRIANVLDTTTDYLLGSQGSNNNLNYIQRNLGKLDEQQLKKAESILKAVFDDIFDDEDE